MSDVRCTHFCGCKYKMTSTSLLALQAFPRLLLYSKCCACCCSRYCCCFNYCFCIASVCMYAIVLFFFFACLTVAWYRRSFLCSCVLCVRDRTWALCMAMRIMLSGDARCATAVTAAAAAVVAAACQRIHNSLDDSRNVSASYSDRKQHETDTSTFCDFRLYIG